MTVGTGSWEVEYTDEFEDWWATLTVDEQGDITAAVEVLETRGPSLGRELVERITSSRHHNMKELRPLGTNLRIFFAFDPVRTAILLIGGDKTGEWVEFYQRMIPIADDLYDEHIRILREEGKI